MKRLWSSAQAYRFWRSKRAPRQGVALVFALWVLVILCAVAMEMKFAAHLRMQVTANLGGATKAFFLARAGVERAVAELKDRKTGEWAHAAIREDDMDAFQNVECGEGTYTLFAGMDADGECEYGLIDESAKINVNKAGVAVLLKIPGMETAWANDIEVARKEEPFRELDDLLRIEGLDQFALFGEDQNGNGLLDDNENDGEASWPPDNEDGELNCGLAAYLTVYSAYANITPEGEPRADLNSASADDLASEVSGISMQQAESIVAHRDKGKFNSPLDLLDVELMEQASGQSGKERDKEAKRPEPEKRPAPDGKAENGKKEEGEKNGKKKEEPKDKGADKEKAANGDDKSEKGQPKEKSKLKGTGQKAFDEKEVRDIAAYLTTSEGEVIEGEVNINTASWEVLACLPDIDEGLARRIVREREDKPEGFATVAELLDVDDLSVETLKKIWPHLCARSDVYTARSFGVLGNGQVYKCVSAVIDRTDDKVRFRLWREVE